MEDKKVSVIMPVYNRECYLAEAIDSILGQAYRNIELIIVNDASTDRSHQICMRYSLKHPEKIRYVSLVENHGVGHACKTAMQYATGAYVAAAGSDDIQLPEKIAICVRHLESDEKIDMIFSDYEAIDGNGTPLGRSFWFPEAINNDNILNHELRRNYLLNGACVMRNLPQIEYDSSLRSSVDYDMFLKLLVQGFTLKYIPDPLFHYRLHQSNISASYQKTAQSFKYVLSKYALGDLYQLLTRKGIPRCTILNTFGIMSIHREELEEASRHLNEALSSPGGSCQDVLDSHFYLATVLYLEGNAEASRYHLTQALALCPNEPTILNNLGLIESLGGNKRAAREHLTKAITLCPLYLDAKINIEKLENRVLPDRFTKNFLRKEIVHADHARL